MTGYENRAIVKLSGCAEYYATALAYPFAWLDATGHRQTKINMDELPCIPKFPAIKTRKSKYWVRGQLGIQNANDVAFIVFAPWRLANNGITTNNTDCPVLYSVPTAPYATQAFPTVDNAGVWASGAASFNTPYTKAMLINSNGVGIKYRVVGASIRIKYVGNLITCGGMANAFTDPNHATLSGATIVGISQFDTYFSQPISTLVKKNDEYIYLTCTPVQEQDFEFQQDFISNATWTNAPYNNHFMGIVITGLPVGESISWEAILMTEEVGQNVPDKTDTPADPNGVAIATNAIKAETQKKINDKVPIGQLVSEGASELTTTSSVPVQAPIMQTMMDLAPKVLTSLAKV